MASLKLEHIYKVYPNGTKAVNDISLDIQNGEFIVFVGPSGCGKSTTLRMIAGLEDITAGELYIDNNIVNDVEPKDRDIAMVFQNYALYPHMTVYENMAFGLKLRHVPDDVVQEKVLWAADILGIKDYLDRKPRNMSGGQRQRVALGRSILRDPKVMLLDEPLSNLDAKLRTQMRTEIAKLHQKLKTTFIYVTHDQTEAMTLGDRVVVMKGGRIQQVDTPKNLYNYPSNKFVAGFIGTPQMNFFPVTLLREQDKVKVHFKDNDSDLECDYNQLIKVLPEYLDGKHDIILGIRCEAVSLCKPGESGLSCKVSHFEELGSECLIYGNITNDEEIDSSKGQIIIKVKEIDSIKPGDVINVRLDMEKTYFFDEKTEETILHRIPNYNSFDVSVKNNTIMLLSSRIRLPEILETPDIEHCELRVPSDAVIFNKPGIKCLVKEIETIGNKKLVHLLLDNRVFFALASDKDDVSVNQEIEVAFDFTRLTLINAKEDTVLFKPIAPFDSFHASFYNYQSVISKLGEGSFKEYRDNKIKAANDYMDAKIMLENQDYDKKKLEIDNRDSEAFKNEVQKKYDELVLENNRKIKETKEETDKKIKELTLKLKSDKAELKAKNDALFKEKKDKEEKEFKEFKENNTDKEALKRRVDEYHIFKDNYQTDKENSFNLAFNGLTMDYESKVSSLKASRRRLVDVLKKEIKDCKNELDQASNPYGYLDKEHRMNLSRLYKEKQKAVSKAGFVFFLQFVSDYYALCSDIISNKLVQGLGTRVFSKEFRVDMPHDAYQIVENGGIEVVVENNLNYGDVFFVRCSYQYSGESKFLYLKSDKAYKKESKLHVTLDLSRSQITETDMNIRLY